MKFKMNQPATSSRIRWLIAIALVALLLIYGLMQLLEAKSDATSNAATHATNADAATIKQDSAIAREPVNAHRDATNESSELQDLCEHGKQSLDEGSPFMTKLKETEERLHKKALERMANSPLIEQKDMAERIAINTEMGNEYRQHEAQCQSDKANCKPFMVSAALQSRLATFALLSFEGRDPFGLYLANTICELAAFKCNIEIATHWTALEPDNGMAWLNLATQLKRKNDSDGAIKAVNRAAQSKTFTMFSQIMFRALQPGEGDYASKFEAILAYTNALGVPLAQPVYSLSLISDLCRLDAREVQSGALQCEKLAGVMINGADDLLLLNVGARLLSKLKVPKASIEMASDKITALNYAMSQITPEYEITKPYACDSMPVYLKLMNERSQYSEVQMARNWLQQKGMSEAQAAAKARALTKQEMDTFQRQNDERMNQAFKRPF